MATNLEKFEEQNPAIAAWWTNSTFEFAVSLREFAAKRGYLTEGQMAAALRCIEKYNAAKAQQATQVAAAPVVDVARVVNVLTHAKQKLLNPKMRLLANENAFEFSLAPVYGKNAGAVYIKQGETYFGKIANNAFQRSKDCTSELEADIITACKDPEQAAIAYGQKYGICSCCGRLLTNPESIELGIGPICREKFFL